MFHSANAFNIITPIRCISTRGGPK